MKKVAKISPFISGMLAMTLLTGLTGTALAASGQVQYNQAGITVFGETKVAKGVSFTAPNGQQAPSVITYVDAAGGKTNYLSVRQISELLDADVAWNAETGNVDIAPEGSNEVKVTREEYVSPPALPEYSVKAGPFTEIDPAEVDTNGRQLVQLSDTQIIGTTGAGTQGQFRAGGGKYIVFTVKNNGSANQVVRVSRPITVSSRGGEDFSDTLLAPGGQPCVRF